MNLWNINQVRCNPRDTIPHDGTVVMLYFRDGTFQKGRVVRRWDKRRYDFIGPGDYLMVCVSATRAREELQPIGWLSVDGFNSYLIAGFEQKNLRR